MQILFALFLYYSAITCSSIKDTETYYKESLKIYPLSTSGFAPKSLWHLEFDFSNYFDQDSTILPDYILPRSVLDMIFIYSNVSNLRLELGMGSANKFYSLNNKFEFDLPDHGKILFTNSEAKWDYLLPQLSEIFMLSVNQLSDKNNYVFKGFNESSRDSKQNFPYDEKDFRYGSDPRDFICGDFFEVLTSLLPCSGKKGIARILELPHILRAEYISSVLNLAYDKKSKKVNFKIEINIIDENDFINQIDFNTCLGYHESFSKDFREYTDAPKYQWSSSNHKEAQKMNAKFSSSSQNSSVLSQRFITKAHFSFRDSLIHEITNLDPRGADVIWYEYFYDFLEINIKEITIEINSKKISLKDHLEIQYIEGKYYILRFSTKIPGKASLRLEIPFQKKYKSFENYPHDPQRGEDMIQSPILYHFDSSDFKIHHSKSANIIVEIPHPDFSLPFTIITLNMGIFGYLAATIYRIFFDKTGTNKDFVLKKKFSLKKKIKTE